MKRIILLLGTALLVVAAGLQAFVSLQPVPEPTLTKPLKEVLPGALVGWRVEDLDLGDTESMRERSLEILQFDDFAYRSYTQAGNSFAVYAAYWKPGKMPVRLVNQHTPDRCWLQMGWTCPERKWNVTVPFKGGQLQPAQWGVYEINGERTYVYFWHIVDGRAHWYGGERVNRYTSPTVILEDFENFGFNVHREQYFIRITSSRPLEEVQNTPAFQQVLASLATVALGAPDSPAPDAPAQASL